MARRYLRDARGRFASKGVGGVGGYQGQTGGRGARLKTPGNVRAGGGATIQAARLGSTVSKSSKLKPDANALVKAQTNQRLRARATVSQGLATQAPLTGQKARWAARSEMLKNAAVKNEAKAQRLFDNANTAGNTAFNTQSGRIPGRARMNAQTERSFALQQKAAQQRSRADNLERMANTNKGDAAAKRMQRAEAVKASHKGLKKGDTIDGVLYGTREVVKVNAKSVTVKGGVQNFTIPWEAIKPKASPVSASTRKRK